MYLTFFLLVALRLTKSHVLACSQLVCIGMSLLYDLRLTKSLVFRFHVLTTSSLVDLTAYLISHSQGVDH